MKTVRFTSLILLLIAAAGAQAQLRSVTRPTIQLPLGTSTLLQPQFWNASPAIGTATGPRMSYVRVRPPKDRVDPTERERAQLQFEIDCAARGLPSFQFSLAGRYLSGNGVPRDPLKAFELLQSAAEKGHDKAKLVVADFERFVARHERGKAAGLTEDGDGGEARDGGQLGAESEAVHLQKNEPAEAADWRAVGEKPRRAGRSSPPAQGSVPETPAGE